MERNDDDKGDLIAMTADIVSAHVSNNSVSIGDLPAVIQGVFGALAGLGSKAEEAPARPEPRVSIRASVKPDAIACLECGKPHKMLKRHLMDAHGLSPDGYRDRWGLAASYPMVAPNYAAQRRDLAKRIGLGTKRNRAGGQGERRTGTR